MRVIVDFDSCDGNALCMAAAPEIFDVRPDDLLYVLQEQPPQHLWPAAENAARACPKLAIRLES